MTVIFLRRVWVNNPVVIDNEFVKNLLLGIGELDILLPYFANLDQLLTLGPVVESASDVDVICVRMRPVCMTVSSREKSRCNTKLVPDKRVER